MADDEPVQIVAYDPSWPASFERERAELQAAIGGYVVAGIHHAGSTAVPGLDAKPIIDILVGVADLPGSRRCIEPLAGLGYLYVPYRPEEMHWFCKPDPSHRTHHLHLVPADSRRFGDELAFRDYLRLHPDVARDYARLKRGLARQFEHDRQAYTDAKTAFVVAVVERALEEVSRSSRPSPAGSGG